MGQRQTARFPLVRSEALLRVRAARRQVGFPGTSSWPTRAPISSGSRHRYS
ncbi:hypothetical protein HMPREF9621_02155 [Cutibacterium modestum HL037PA2]|nr:hypothetical protein HMPREF9621_02155 [Cutibacterium modestum HL037PA2]